MHFLLSSFRLLRTIVWMAGLTDIRMVMFFTHSDMDYHTQSSGNF